MILDNISNPGDLKKVAQGDLPRLCTQIRELIIDTTSKNGGHLAPSLGVVELAVAIHYIFDSPNDKIIWDVGHQAYAHKILTGRREPFHTLRRSGGISGFPKITESPHDAFGTGHASTSISAALGIAKAFKRKGINNRAIAVIGDGSITGGMAFEALNQAGHKAGNLLVVLNDNEMAISPSVGALSRFLSINIHGRMANRLRRHLKKLLLIIPVWGKRIYNLAQKAEDTAVGFFTPGLLFEAFGFDYIGPLDGHNIDEMIDVFHRVKNLEIGDRPILIHVLTKKGRGYRPAEEDSVRFHGTGPFDRESGRPLSDGNMTYTKAFSDALLEVAEEDPKVVAVTAAMATGTGLDKFAERYPDRFYDVGIAEGHAVTFAAGLATEGYRPVVAIYSTFLQRAYDQIIHDVCLQNLPITFALDRAGLVGDDGPTHHGQFDISYLRSMPNMVLMAPRDADMMTKMLGFAVEHNGPVAIRYPRGKVPKVEAKDFDNVIQTVSQFPSPGGRGKGRGIPPPTMELGDEIRVKAEIVYNEKDPSVVIWAVGHLVSEAIKAAELLCNEGIPVTVVDPRFIRPFDFQLFREFAESCPNVVTVEENVLAGGFGSMISEWLNRERLSEINLKCLGIPDQFVEHASQNMLRAECGIDTDGIIKAIKQQLGLIDSKNKRVLIKSSFPSLACPERSRRDGRATNNSPHLISSPSRGEEEKEGVTIGEDDRL